MQLGDTVWIVRKLADPDLPGGVRTFRSLGKEDVIEAEVVLLSTLGSEDQRAAFLEHGLVLGDVRYLYSAFQLNSPPVDSNFESTGRVPCVDQNGKTSSGSGSLGGSSGSRGTSTTRTTLG